MSGSARSGGSTVPTAGRRATSPPDAPSSPSNGSQSNGSGGIGTPLRRAAIKGRPASKARAPATRAAKVHKAQTPSDAAPSARQPEGVQAEESTLPSGARIRARLFDADHRDRILTWDDVMASKPTDRQLLWLDIEGDLSSDEADTLGKRVRLETRTRRAIRQQLPE